MLVGQRWQGERIERRDGSDDIPGEKVHMGRKRREGLGMTRARRPGKRMAGRETRSRNALDARRGRVKAFQ